MVPKERAKAVGSQPTGPGEDQVGGAHGDENGATGTAPVSMAAGGPGSPPGARKGHMEMRPDQGLLKEGQGVPRGGVGVLPRPGPAPRPPASTMAATAPPHPRSAREEEDQEGTTLVERKDVAEEWRQEQSRKTRTLARVVTQA